MRGGAHHYQYHCPGSCIDPIMTRGISEAGVSAASLAHLLPRFPSADILGGPTSTPGQAGSRLRRVLGPSAQMPSARIQSASGFASARFRVGSSRTRLDHTLMIHRTYLYDIDKRFLPVLILFGLRSKSDGVSVGEDGRLFATFGLLRVETHLSNVADAHITMDYRWWTAIGARTSFCRTTDSLSAPTASGLCIHFKEKVPSAFRRKGHSLSPLPLRIWKD